MDRSANSLLRRRLEALIPPYYINARDWDEICILLPQMQLFSTKPQHRCNMYEPLRKLILKAVEYEYLDRLKWLCNLILERAPDVRYLEKIFDKRYPNDGTTIVSHAVRNKNLDTVRFLVETCCPSRYEILKETDNYGFTPLDYAIRDSLVVPLSLIAYLVAVTPRSSSPPWSIRYPSGSTLAYVHITWTPLSIQVSPVEYCYTSTKLVDTLRKGLSLREAQDALKAEMYLKGMDNELPVLVLNVLGQQSELLYHQYRDDTDSRTMRYDDYRKLIIDSETASSPSRMTGTLKLLSIDGQRPQSYRIQ